MMTWNRPPGEEEPLGQIRRLLLLAGICLAGLAVVVIWLMNGSPSDAQAAQTTSMGTSISTATHSREIYPSGDTTGEVTEAQASTDGSAKTSASRDEDTVESLTVEACLRFRKGATVAEFSTWFEHNVELGAGSKEMFGTIISRALTEECPEVVPD